MINAFHSVLIALMQRIHAQIPGFLFRLGAAALADQYLRRSGFGEMDPPLPVGFALPQTVQMRNRDFGKPLSIGSRILRGEAAAPVNLLSHLTTTRMFTD
ncbi:MAG: hypothetical protein SGI92_11715 [Bryobacteraceae bacterium]|nr:hypothetical protein [Bryobacteraceae bacterium]